MRIFYLFAMVVFVMTATGCANNGQDSETTIF